MIGWYHIGSKNWGCFKGHKDIKNYSQVTNFEVADKWEVLEGSMKKSFLETQTIIDPIFAPRFMQRENEDSVDDKNKTDEVNFLEMNSKMESMSQNELVEKINSLNLSWKAAEYEQFEGLSNEEIHELMKNGNTELTKKSSKKI